MASRMTSCHGGRLVEGMGGFVIGSAQAARQTVRDHAPLALGCEDQAAFAAALLDDAPPGECLRAAGQCYWERRGS